MIKSGNSKFDRKVSDYWDEKKVTAGETERKKVREVKKKANIIEITVTNTRRYSSIIITLEPQEKSKKMNKFYKKIKLEKN